MARSLQGSYASTIGLMIPLIRHRAHNAFWLEVIGGLRQGDRIIPNAGDVAREGLKIEPVLQK